jgi:hypothetical protein
MAVHNVVKCFISEITCLEDEKKVNAIRKCLINRCCEDYQLNYKDRLALINCLSQVNHSLAIDLLLDIVISHAEFPDPTGFKDSVGISELKKALTVLSKKAKSNTRVVRILCQQIGGYCFFSLERVTVLESICTKDHISELLVLATNIKNRWGASQWCE